MPDFLQSLLLFHTPPSGCMAIHSPIIHPARAQKRKGKDKEEPIVRFAFSPLPYPSSNHHSLLPLFFNERLYLYISWPQDCLFSLLFVVVRFQKRKKIMQRRFTHFPRRKKSSFFARAHFENDPGGTLSCTVICAKRRISGAVPP